MRAALLVLCGCSRLFGLEHPELLDAHGGDGRITDTGTSVGCPVGAAPSFATAKLSVVQKMCSDYVVSGTLASGYCSGKVSVGPVGGSLLPVDLTGSGALLLDDPRLFETGHYLAARGTTQSGIAVMVFKNLNDTTWSYVISISLPFAIDDRTRFGSLSDGADHRAMVYTGDGKLHEIGATETGSTREISVYAASDLGVATFDREANITTDGLRIVFASSTVLYYSARASLDDRFRPAALLAGLTGVTDAYLMADCSRLYFSTSDGVSYIEH